ncbi:MAG: hypothetical protein KDD51_08115 [Bdellovibrionales bacterium]|nr:hypothetical protein [Bdellovibrionales bacterium]
MGYYVKAQPKKKSLPHWKLQYISFKKTDTTLSKAKKPKREWDISKDRWLGLGFNKQMTLEEARARARQINAQLHLRRQEEQIRKIEEEQAEFQLRYDSILPTEFVAEFELRFIRKRDSQTMQGLRKNTRSYTVWRASQKMIVAVGIEPSEWFCHTHRIYDYFHSEQMSLRYLNSVLRYANLWGFFICRKLGRPFLPVPMPKGYERQRLLDANYSKQKGVSRASKHITPKTLEKAAKLGLNRRNLNWLHLSVWFGLRPKVIDQLRQTEMWRVETLANGREILWVFQTKIVALPPEDRWKPIPILFEEQRFGLRIIRDGTFRRPILKTMKRYFGKGVTTYGGRKGFTDLMLSKGQTLENISVWMGHSSLQRTWYSYKSLRRFHVPGY